VGVKDVGVGLGVGLGVRVRVKDVGLEWRREWRMWGLGVGGGTMGNVLRSWCMATSIIIAISYHLIKCC
jgi:hypothetical protein